MKEQFTLLDDGIFQIVYRIILKKNDDIRIGKTYSNYRLTNISVREASTDEKEKPLFSINSNLEMTFNDDQLNGDEKETILGYFKEMGFPVES